MKKRYSKGEKAEIISEILVLTDHIKEVIFSSKIPEHVTGG